MVPEILSATEFFVILGHFLPFYHPDNQENQNFEKMKTNPGYNIILHMCTINDDHMMHGATDRIFHHFWTIFCPFPLRTWKIKIWKK